MNEKFCIYQKYTRSDEQEQLASPLGEEIVLEDQGVDEVLEEIRRSHSSHDLNTRLVLPAPLCLSQELHDPLSVVQTVSNVHLHQVALRVGHSVDVVHEEGLHVRLEDLLALQAVHGRDCVLQQLFGQDSDPRI